MDFYKHKGFILRELSVIIFLFFTQICHAKRDRPGMSFNSLRRDIPNLNLKNEQSSNNRSI
ncbi:MAG: hypothetical protein PVI26_06030, partial [Chitinispirillia bacterium]